MTSRLVLGKGINDSDTAVSVDGKKCPFYEAWKSMLSRCYSQAVKSNSPTYNDCHVCSEWLLYSNFRNWMRLQDWEGKELDKDIMFPGNKIYHPAYCVFVTPEVNRLLNDHGRKRGDLPQGVTRHRDRFRAKCKYNGSSVSLGVFLTVDAAVNAYRSFKQAIILELAQKQSDDRIKQGLITHAARFA